MLGSETITRMAGDLQVRECAVRIGDEVLLAGGEIGGTVRGLLLRAAGEVQVEVVWWIDGVRHIEWVGLSEATVRRR